MFSAIFLSISFSPVNSEAMKNHQKKLSSSIIFIIQFFSVSLLYSCADVSQKNSQYIKSDSGLPNSESKENITEIMAPPKSQPQLDDQDTIPISTDKVMPSTGLDVVNSSAEKKFEEEIEDTQVAMGEECNNFVKNKINKNINFPNLNQNLNVVIKVELNSDKYIENLHTVIPSGNSAFDMQVERGIRKSNVFPADCPKYFLFSSVLKSEMTVADSKILIENQNLEMMPSESGVAAHAYENKVNDLNQNKIDIEKKLTGKNNNAQENILATDKKDEKKSESSLSKIDGDWYSKKWKYGYTLKNGKGYATSTNSPNFDIGQEIVRLTPSIGDSFVGENIYKDGKFYKVKVSLRPDGKLFFEGEKNVKWVMERAASSRVEQEKYKLQQNIDTNQGMNDSEVAIVGPRNESSVNQKRFMQIVQEAQSASRSASNDMQRGGVKARRDKAICEMVSNAGGLKITNWSGRIINLSANGDGKGILEVEIAPGISVKTWNNSLSDTFHKTLISPGSKLFEKASAMHVGQFVQFSGTFHSGSGTECVYEASISLIGKISQPEFIMTFSDIKKR